MPALDSHSDLEVRLKLDTTEFDAKLKQMEARLSLLHSCWNCRTLCVWLFCWDCVRSWLVGLGTAFLIKWLVS